MALILKGTTISSFFIKSKATADDSLKLQKIARGPDPTIFWQSLLNPFSPRYTWFLGRVMVNTSHLWEEKPVNLDDPANFGFRDCRKTQGRTVGIKKPFNLLLTQAVGVES